MFPKLDKAIEEPKYTDFTDKLKIQLVDCYVADKDVLTARHELFLDESMVKWGYEMIRWIYNHTIQLCKWEVIDKPAEWETPATYRAIPKNLDELKSMSLSDFPECTETAHYYLIDKIVSESTEEWTFESFISVIK